MWREGTINVSSQKFSNSKSSAKLLFNTFAKDIISISVTNLCPDSILWIAFLSISNPDMLLFYEGRMKIFIRLLCILQIYSLYM